MGGLSLLSTRCGRLRFSVYEVHGGRRPNADQKGVLTDYVVELVPELPTSNQRQLLSAPHAQLKPQQSSSDSYNGRRSAQLPKAKTKGKVKKGFKGKGLGTARRRHADCRWPADCPASNEVLPPTALHHAGVLARLSEGGSMAKHLLLQLLRGLPTGLATADGACAASFSLGVSVLAATVHR